MIRIVVFLIFAGFAEQHAPETINGKKLSPAAREKLQMFIDSACGVKRPSPPNRTPAQPIPPGHGSCNVDSDCRPEPSCHPKRCLDQDAYEIALKEWEKEGPIACTQDCQRPLDCGMGRCGCVENQCAVIQLQ